MPMVRQNRRLVAAAFAPILALSWACGGDGTGVSNAPASVTATTTTSLGGTAGSAVTPAPAVIVKNAAGTPLADIPVTFAVTAGGGSLTGATARTGADGIATVGSWTLGTASGANRLTAKTANVDAVLFTATAGAGPAATIVKLVEAAGSLVVSTAVTTRPSVRITDQFGNPVTGQSVAFTAGPNSGTVTGDVVNSGPDGVATVGGWTLGTRAGSQTLHVAAGSAAGAIFTAAAIADVPASLMLTAGFDQIAEVGTAVALAPAVKVADQYGNATPGRSVTFAVAGGGGSVSGASVTANVDGIATIGSWTLGAEGINTVSATAQGVPVLEIVAKAVPRSEFDIELRFLTSATSSQRTAFTRAVARWRKSVIGDIPNIAGVSVGADSTCGVGEPALVNETIDDVMIYVSLVPIDGAGKILGGAGPCLVRSVSGTTLVGAMQFDVADLPQLEQIGLLESVVLHEMGHVFGLGVYWDNFGYLVDAGTADPYYTGPSARAGFQLVGGSTYAGNPVPVENVGGGGTRDSHWRNTVLRTELMTGFAEQTARLPLSMVTVGGMEDLGYLVTPFGYDAFAFGANVVAAPGGGASATVTLAGPPLQLREAPLSLRVKGVDGPGRLTEPPPRPRNAGAGRVPALARQMRTLPNPPREVRALTTPRPR